MEPSGSINSRTESRDVYVHAHYIYTTHILIYIYIYTYVRAGQNGPGVKRTALKNFLRETREKRSQSRVVYRPVRFAPASIINGHAAAEADEDFSFTLLQQRGRCLRLNFNLYRNAWAVRSSLGNAASD